MSFAEEDGCEKPSSFVKHTDQRLGGQEPQSHNAPPHGYTEYRLREESAWVGFDLSGLVHLFNDRRCRFDTPTHFAQDELQLASAEFQIEPAEGFVHPITKLVVVP